MWYDIQEGPIPLLSGVHPGTPSRSQPDARARVLRAKPEVPYFYAKRQKGGPGYPSGDPLGTPMEPLHPQMEALSTLMLTGTYLREDIGTTMM